MRIERCRWTRRRLPLLAGDREGRDLTRDEFRRVERHLITCAPCRSELASLETAVGALRASASIMPDAPPSIWPALEREIRRSRRPHRPVVLGLGMGPAMGLAAGLVVVGGLIGMVGWTLGTHSRPQHARADGPGYPRRPALPDGPPGAGVIAVQQGATPALDAAPPPTTGQ